MQLVRYDNFAGIDQLWIDDAPMPQAEPGQVVVRVIATCINPGALSALNGAPYTPVRDVAGIIVSVHGAGGDFAVGDAVLGWAQTWTAHAEFVVVPADQLVAKPAEVTWSVAGSLFVTPMAGLAGVLAVAPEPEETVVVSGASGGVGFTSAQLAARRGATVIGLGSARSHSLLREHGILPVRYGDGQARGIEEAAQSQPISAFIDTVGSGYVDLAVSLGVPADRINTVVDFAAAKQHGVTTRGTMDAGGLPALLSLADLVAAGRLLIPIAADYPLCRVKDAYHFLADGRPAGRVVLHP